MEIIITFLIFLWQTIYSTLSAISANIAPVIFGKIPFLKYPLDFNKTFNGKPILGPHKTFRGLFFGISFSMVIINLQFLFFKITGVDWTIYGFGNINFELLGFLMGFGVILGDVVKSFFKRQLNIEPGKSFIPWDQIDCVLGGLILGRIAWDFPWAYGITIIIATFLMHIIFRHIYYYLGLCSTKW